MVSVHAQDSAGNWGPYTTINLTVDSAGPTTSGLAANPQRQQRQLRPEQQQPIGPGQRDLSDVASGGARIAAGEGFIDGAVVNGTGFPFYAADGTFTDHRVRPSTADIPLTTINALSAATTRSVSTARTRSATGARRRR